MLVKKNLGVITSDIERRIFYPGGDAAWINLTSLAKRKVNP
jgi:hypothetical protein